MAGILAIDFGEKRIGLAIATTEARLPRPYRTLINAPDLLERLREIINEEDIRQVIVGLPRSLEGNETAQTVRARKFADSLSVLKRPIRLQDEAATSSQARAELDSRGLPYAKSDIDKLAACYILEDYLREKELAR